MTAKEYQEKRKQDQEFRSAYMQLHLDHVRRMRGDDQDDEELEGDYDRA